MKNLIPLLMAAAACVAPVCAATCANPPVPGIWSAAYTYKHEPQRPDDPAQARIFDRMQIVTPQPKARRVWATADRRRIVIDWMVGRSTEAWIAGGYLVYTRLNFGPGDLSLFPIPNGRSGEEQGFPELVDFPELAWLRADLKKDMASYQGRGAEHYVLPGAAGAPPVAQAWLDPKTRLPIVAEDSRMTVTYQFSDQAPAPSDMEMPSAYAQAITRAGKATPPAEVP